MFRRIRLPSPALTVATIALLVALTGSAAAITVAAVPLAKRALQADNARHAAQADNAKHAALADNAKLVGGKSSDALLQAANQAAAQAAAQTPGPASSAAGLITVKSAAWTFPPSGQGDASVQCDAGQKAIAGGWDDVNGYGHPWDTRPTPDGSGWRVYVTVNPNAPGPQTGTVYAICLK